MAAVRAAVWAALTPEEKREEDAQKEAERLRYLALHRMTPGGAHRVAVASAAYNAAAAAVRWRHGRRAALFRRVLLFGVQARAGAPLSFALPPHPLPSTSASRADAASPDAGAPVRRVDRISVYISSVWQRKGTTLQQE